MPKTPQRLAWELYRENKNASTFDITFCVEAEITTVDRQFVNSVVREYDRLRTAASQLAGVRGLAGMGLAEPGTDFKRST